MGSSAWASPVAPASCSNPNCLPKAARKSGRNSHLPRVNIIFALPPWPPRTRHMVSFWDGCSRRNGRRGMTVAPRRELTPEESSSPRSIDDGKSSVRLRVSGDEAQTGTPGAVPLVSVGRPDGSNTCHSTDPPRCQAVPFVQARSVSPREFPATTGCLRSDPGPGAATGSDTAFVPGRTSA